MYQSYINNFPTAFNPTAQPVTPIPSMSLINQNQLMYQAFVQAKQFEMLQQFQKFQFHQHLHKIYFNTVEGNSCSRSDYSVKPSFETDQPSSIDRSCIDLRDAKIETDFFKIEGNSSETCSIYKKEEEGVSPDQPYLRNQINNMMRFIHKEIGSASEEQIGNERNKYINNTTLLKLFDTLVERYLSTGKCREDMIRFVFRKALTYIRNSLRSQYRISSKAASMLLCQKYFQIDQDEMLKHNVDISNEEEVLNFLLPYKKKSRNRTPNMQFVTEIFASKVFYEDYVRFLSILDELLDAETETRNAKFVDFLLECIQKDSVHKVKKYKRLPWLKGWLEATKAIAYELLNAKTWKMTNNIPKRRGKKIVKRDP